MRLWIRRGTMWCPYQPERRAAVAEYMGRKAHPMKVSKRFRICKMLITLPKLEALMSGSILLDAGRVAELNSLQLQRQSHI